MSMSQALLLYILRKDTIMETCSNLSQTREVLNNEPCGFVILFAILQETFPHTGAPCLDVVETISTLTVLPKETFSSFHTKAMAIQNNLQVSRNKVPATSLVKRFLEGYSQNPKAEIVLTTINYVFIKHLQQKGPDVPFNLSLTEIYNFIKKSKIDPHHKIRSHPSSMFQKHNTSAAEIAPTNTTSLLLMENSSEHQNPY